jgi:UDP-N-acetylglucosamine 2-epimerase (hydrolysing)
MQLGEPEGSVFVVGSPEVDVMLSSKLPALSEVRRRYELPEESYGVAVFHPVTTEPEDIRRQAEEFVSALMETDRNYVVIEPNNDEGRTDILVAYRRLDESSRFYRFPSLRFEWYLTLLRHADIVVGNSSSGVREAPVFGTPSVDVGSRQNGRAGSPSIWHVPADCSRIVEAIEQASRAGPFPPDRAFGHGTATKAIVNVLEDDAPWAFPLSKEFHDF